MDYLTILASHIQRARDFLERELAGLRTGRANPSLIERLSISCYGSVSPLQEVAAIHSPEPQQLVVQPWDPGIIRDIERALSQSTLGVTPVVEGKIIRLPFPPMTDDRRQELLRLVKDKGEQAKVRIRVGREEVVKKLRQQERDRQISEDELEAAMKTIQSRVDQATTDIDASLTRKRDELETR
ncbi:MAG: ribosome recycling factor [Candidatus Kerfeldbacteria bacterium]|nr:ribosome recycling factor [Candidatus Kerfeldbacteria bacterium]